MEEDTARKITMLLSASAANLPRNVTDRLAQSRRRALSHRRGSIHTLAGRTILTMPHVLGASSLLFAGLVALAWFSLQPAFPLDDALHPDQLPERAYVDHDFAAWSNPDIAESADEE